METLDHVHADDVAQVFFNAITHRKSALGESFHAVGAESITLLGYVQAMYNHIVRSGYYSIEKGKRLLEYYPRHTLLETVEESVAYMVEHQWFER